MAKRGKPIEQPDTIIDYAADIGLVEPSYLHMAAKAAGVYTFDIETMNPTGTGGGLSPFHDRIEGIAFYVPRSPAFPLVRAWYPFVNHTFMFRGKNGDIRDVRPAMDQDKTMEGLRPLFADESLVAVAHNAKFDTAFLWHASGTSSPIEVRGRIADSMIADYLSDERRRRYGLKERVKQVFGHQMTTYKDIRRGTVGLPGFNVKPLGFYAMDDCQWTYAHFDKAIGRLRAQTPAPAGEPTRAIEKEMGRRLGTLEAIFWGISTKLSRIIMEMETTGVLLDWRHLYDVEQRLKARQVVLQTNMENCLGWPFSVGSQRNVVDALFGPPPSGLGLPSMGLVIGKNGLPSTADKSIKHFARFHPLVQDALEVRSNNTVLSGFVVKLQGIARSSHDGRLRSGFHQTGTVIGRLSSSSPVNLQNQPRDKDLVRKAFCAHLITDKDQDLQLLGGDYCVARGTRVNTTRGPIAVEAVTPGDMVIIEDGSLHTVSARIDKGPQAVRTITTRMGYELTATALHRIRVVDENGDYVWRRVGELQATDRVAIQRGGWYSGSPWLLPPVPDATHLNQRSFTLPAPDERLAYLLGYILGDGSVQPKEVSLVVGHKENDLVAPLMDTLRSYGLNPLTRSYRGVTELRVRSKLFSAWVRSLMPEGKRALPVWVGYLDRSLASVFLRGLFDSDGSVSGGRISWSGKHRQLALDVQHTLLRLGVPTIRSQQTTKLNGKSFALHKLAVPSAYGEHFQVTVGFAGAEKQRRLNEYLLHAGTSAEIGSYPNLQRKVKALNLSGEPRVLLANTSGLGRPVSLKLAQTLQRTAPDVFEALALFRTVHYGTMFDAVDSVVDTGTVDVFDLTVPGPTTYVSDGFVSHNSQIELRVASHYAQENNMREVYLMGKVCQSEAGQPCQRYHFHECKKCGHTAIPKTHPDGTKTCVKCMATKLEHQARCRHVDLHQRTAEDANVKRNPLAKNLNFGLLYRMAAPKFCVYADLFDADGRPTVAFAQEVVARWHAAYPAIKIFHELVEQTLPTKGWIATTLTGRRRRLIYEAQTNNYRAITQGIQFMVSGCVAEGTHVLTSDGYVAINKLDPSVHRVFDGKEWSDHYVVRQTGAKECFELKLTDGRRLTCSGDHRFAMMSGLEMQWPPLRDLRPGDVVATHEVLCPSGDLDHAVSVDEAYLIGILVGDGYYGTTKGFMLAASDKEPDWAKEIERSVLAVFGSSIKTRMNWSVTATSRGGRVRTLTVHSAEARRMLMQIGLNTVSKQDKRLPAWLLTAAPEVRAAALAGLIDTDGSVLAYKQHNGVYSLTINYSSRVQALVIDAWRLAASLGINASISSFDSVDAEGRPKTQHRLSINYRGHQAFERWVLLRHPRKAATLHTTLRSFVGNPPRRAFPASFVKAVAELVAASPALASRMGTTTVAVDAKHRRRVQSYVGHARDGKAGENMLTAMLDYAGEAGPKEVLSLGWASIESITSVGARQTYDIEMLGNNHAFVAEGLLTHNSAQDLIQIAMVRLYEERARKLATVGPEERKLWEKFRFLLQIHDECLFQTPKQIAAEAGEMFKRNMETADGGMLSVPLICEIKTGRTWDDVH